MALTAEGKQLTEAHRLAQIGIGAEADAVARLLWPALNAADLDGSEPAWMSATLESMRPYYEESASLGRAYIGAYREAESAVSDAFGQVRWNPALMAANLHLAGPVRVKLLVKGGMTGDAAHAAALTKFTGIVRRGVLSGGRQMIHETARRDSNAVGWRRVTDGDPCTFCAMLATRGPVYGQRSVRGDVLRPDRMGGMGLNYHGHCGCTGELVYGEWEPNGLEQLFIDEYERAAAEVDALGLPRTQQTVLPRMRANGTFRDSPLSRNKQTSGP